MVSPVLSESRSGSVLYQTNCAICHQAEGQGISGVFPPLAKSDFLVTQPERTIRAVVAGLHGEITVNGKSYHGTMPASLLNDEAVASVLTYVYSQWENDGRTVTAESVAEVRQSTKFTTFDQLIDANDYAPLPKPPKGLALREVIRLDNHGVRLGKDSHDRLYLLTRSGDVHRINIKDGTMEMFLPGASYLNPNWESPQLRGFTIDSKSRFYVVTNQRNKSVKPVQNQVIIFRGQLTEEGSLTDFKPWFQTTYPWGIGGFQHCVGHIAEGPDGMIYVASGSRTDANEPAPDKDYYQGGEVDKTACIWRLDPSSANPKLEVYASGIRNAYGFCWDAEGQLFCTENGPNAHAPEEFLYVERGKHYGFPYRFSDWQEKTYVHSPDPPKDLSLILPIANLGPAGGGSEDAPIFSFEPHSSPAGLIYLDHDYPLASYRDSFLVTRFGNMVQPDSAAGFDLLQLKLGKNIRSNSTMQTTAWLTPLGRPLDLVKLSNHRIYILEFSRNLSNEKGAPMQPGRILELSPSSR